METKNELSIELADSHSSHGAKIRVVGVGGGGGNALNSMISRGLDGVDFIAANTDAQALHKNLASSKIQIGQQLTRGLGAGAEPTVGSQAVEESIDDVREALSGSDMIFVTAGMGGGTGTGGAPVVARIGRELNALVVGIVTRPFAWEAKRRSMCADIGITELRKNVDALIVIPNERLLDIIDDETTFEEAFQKVDDVLYNATKGISDIISGTGYVNVDFADVRTVMKDMGDALMGIGVSSGPNRAEEAAIKAINSPLLDDVSIEGSKGILVNISASSKLTMREISTAINTIESAAGDGVNLIFGVVVNPNLEDQIMVTVVATGFAEAQQQRKIDRENVLVGNTQQQNVLPHQQQYQPTYTQQQQPTYQEQVYHLASSESNVSTYIAPTVVQPSMSQNIPIEVMNTQQNINDQQQEILQQNIEYQSEKIAANGGGPTHFPPQFNAAIDQQRNYEIPQSAPVGHNNLSKFDVPAYARRTGTTQQNPSFIQEPQQNSSNSSANKQQTIELTKQTTPKDRSPIERPAFLRRIMD